MLLMDPIASVALPSILVPESMKMKSLKLMPKEVEDLSLRMVSRHGLVTGATGSGKTRTLQLMAEQLSAAGVSVFMPDMKGDITGMAQEGAVSDKITERAKALNTKFTPSGFPVEIYSLSGVSLERKCEQP